MAHENVLNRFDQTGGNDNVFRMGGTANQGGTGTFNADGTLQIAGTTLTATAAEINKADTSAETETILTGAISVVKRITNLDTTGGAELYTLAAPDASMLGLVKVVHFLTDNGDATLTLTNVQGGSAATTATWANVGEDLVLVAGADKWNVIGEGGVVLS